MPKYKFVNELLYKVLRGILRAALLNDITLKNPAQPGKTETSRVSVCVINYSVEHQFV